MDKVLEKGAFEVIIDSLLWFYSKLFLMEMAEDEDQRPAAKLSSLNFIKQTKFQMETVSSILGDNFILFIDLRGTHFQSQDLNFVSCLSARSSKQGDVLRPFDSSTGVQQFVHFISSWVHGKWHSSTEVSGWLAG